MNRRKTEPIGGAMTNDQEHPPEVIGNVRR